MKCLRPLPTLVAIVSTAWPAAAEVDVRALARAALHTTAVPSGGPMGRAEISAVVELPASEDPAMYGLPTVASRWSAVTGSVGTLDALARAHPGWRLTWSAPLHPLLDQAAGWVHAVPYRNETGRTGKDVLVGIIDTGVDVTHPDFRGPDGATRIAWLIDFAGAPLGVHSEVEAKCAARCAVRTGAEIDALIASGRADELPRDVVGHGTHVASLAVGNGGDEGKYVGIAPEASLVVARAIDASGEITDPTVLAAAELVFFLAEQEGKKRGLDRLPAVVNVSLGSDFGPHDGSSALERGLGDLVGPESPGRAIVVAAGNSAGLIAEEGSFPDPLGVHTEVHVPELSSVRVPLVPHASRSAPSELSAVIQVWIAFRAGDRVLVGIDRRDGPWVQPIGPGRAEAYTDGKKLNAQIFNGAVNRADPGLPEENAAVVVIDGTWPRSETFAIRLEGSGTASLWVQSDGDLGPGAGSLGALFPGATKQSTIALPGGHAELISVGATLNRTEWTDRTGHPRRLQSLGGVVQPQLESVAYFSAAGPTWDDRLKPDILAPGAFVAGAMSRHADPSENAFSVFGDGGFCEPASDCAVLDGTHAVTAGTSMAAPIVAGAIALLFEGDPSLTQDRLMARLQAGAHRPPGRTSLDPQLGAGILDLAGALDVERAESVPVRREPDRAHSWLTLGQTYAHPAERWSLPALLQLRDSRDRAADGFDATELRVDVARGSVTRELERVAPGLWRFAVGATPGTGGDTLDVNVRLRDRLIATRSIPIAVDVNVARQGFSARGGCVVVAPAPVPGTDARAAVLAALLIVGRGRRRSRAARMARSPDRTGSSARGPRGSCRR